VQLRELRNKINNPEDFLNKEYAESLNNKIEPPVENQYEIIEEKDYHNEQQHTAKQSSKDKSSAESNVPATELRPESGPDKSA
jgi:hypothetical protein